MDKLSNQRMKRPLHITLIGPLPSSRNTGGPETITYNLAKALNELGNKIYVIKGFFGDPLPLNQSTIEVYDVIRPVIIKKSHVIHVILGLKSGGYIGALLAKVLGKPLVTHFHQPPDRSFTKTRHIKYKILNSLSSINTKMFDNSEVVISVSNYSKEALLNIYGIDSIVIPPGVDTTYFTNINKDPKPFLKKYGLKSDEKRILFVGNLIPRKRVELLIHAFQKVKRKAKDSSLIIVGDGVEKHRLINLANKLNLNDIHFLGRIPKNDLLYAYLSSHIFVLPSSEEGLGIVLLEAMACGLPIVASRTSGVLDVVDNGKTGILVSPKNVSALAEAMVKLLSDETMRSELGKAAQKHVRTYFDWRIIAQKIEDVYLSLVRKNFE